jgi:pilus assembly protein CpaE
MTEHHAACVVVSTSEEFAQGLRRAPSLRSDRFRIEAEIQAPFPEITDSQLQVIRDIDPDVIFLDLESNPQIGLRFAQFLVDAEMGDVLVGSAPPLSSELLMEAMRAGISEFIPKPLEAATVEKSLEQVWRKTGRKSRTERGDTSGDVIIFLSAKGGSGCTTLCANVGVELHRVSRKKTLLLDLDLELGETALQMGVEPKFSVVDLVRNFHRVDSDLLASYIEHHESGVDILSAPYQPAEFEAVSGELVGKILRFLKEQYDYVVVDAPKHLGPVTLAALRAADHVLLVTTPDLPSLRNLTRCLPLLEEIGESKTQDWLRIVVNRHESRGLVSLDQVEETLGRPVFGTVRNDYDTVMEAINTGTPAVTMGPSDFAQDVRTVAGELAGVDVESTSDRGWLQRLFDSLRNGRSRTSRNEASMEVTANG